MKQIPPHASLKHFYAEIAVGDLTPVPGTENKFCTKAVAVCPAGMC